MRIRAALRAGQAWLYPWHCLLCGATADLARDLCAACAAELPRHRHACRRCGEPLAAPAARCGRCLQRPPPLDRVYAAFAYEAPVQGLLTGFKYRRSMAAGRVLAEAAADRIAAAVMAGELGLPDVLVPVPLHHRRLWRRGFDQAWLIAGDLRRVLCTEHGLDPGPRRALLRRTRATRAQARLDLVSRRRNLRGAFAAQTRPPAHVVLVDDVMTSGSTLAACALALRAAGCERVEAWVLARAPRPAARAGGPGAGRRR
jgi:ComF family protein